MSNPPFGREWKKNELKAVMKEAKQGFAGRFGPGLPPTNDSQMLFLLTAIAKMKPQGTSRIAIIHNGSPLFSGEAESGSSNIREYILKHDLLETVIALPNDIFYNTGIATYIWILTNNKSPQRKGKVQLINANGIYTKMRKSLGQKHNEISDEQIEEICQIYNDFQENHRCKIFNNEDFGYQRIIIERPLVDDSGELNLKLGKAKPDPELRDTENIPINEDAEEFFEREIKPFAPEAWIDKKKTKKGYEIPFTRYFYEYDLPPTTDEIEAEIRNLTAEINAISEEVFAK